MKYPGIPVGGQDGARYEHSSYLHVIVCYAEWQEMKALVGAERARTKSWNSGQAIIIERFTAWY